MNDNPTPSLQERLGYDKDSKEKLPWEHYLGEYRQGDPVEMAERTGIEYEESSRCLILPFLGSTYKISHPDFKVTHLPDERLYYPLEEMIQARILTARFLLRGAKTYGSGAFRTYREMPWGDVYLRQFDGRCIKRLAFSWGNRIANFCAVMDHLQAEKTGHGDASYRIELFPGYRMELILWEGDEEFSPSAQILFSDNFPASFQAEDMAVAGDVIIGSLKAFGKALGK